MYNPEIKELIPIYLTMKSPSDEIAFLKKELEIERALDRIRKLTLQIQDTEDLQKVVQVLYQEMEAYDLGNWGGNIMIFHEATQSIEIFLSSSEESDFGREFFFPEPGHPVIKEQWKNWQAQKDEVVIALEGKEKKSYDQYVFQKTDFKHFPAEIRSGIASLPRVYFSFVYFRYGYIVSISSESPLQPAQFHILKKFTRTFELAYTRYLDIKLAREQAFQAKIEVALERVRSTSMAMQETSDLMEVVQVMQSQLIALNVSEEGVSVVLCKKDKNELEYWFADSLGTDHLSSYTIKGRKNYYIRKFWSYFENKEFGQIILEGEKKWKYDTYLLEETGFKDTPKEFQEEMLKSPKVCFSIAPMEYGFLEAVDIDPLPAPKIAILTRFAKVFEQAYTRFLDLQKAEAQAREAKIETALEKVRSRTIAMHQSSELAEVANDLYKQLKILGVELYRSNIAFVNEESNTAEIWSTTPEGKGITKSSSFPLTEHDLINFMYQVWKKQSNETYFIQGKKRVEWTEYIMRYVDFKEYQDQNIDLKKIETEPAIFNIFSFRQGFFFIHTKVELKKSELSIIARFAKVFEQTYTRFLDLQKAEAQAWEAQIEAALERVRSRTMAMHKTSELRDVAAVMYQQMENIGLAKWGCTIYICHEDTKEFEFWLAEETDSDLSENYFGSGVEHPVYRNVWNKWQDQSPPFTLHHTDAYKREFDEYWLYKTDFIRLPEEVKSSVLNSREVFLHYATMRYGLLNAATFESVSDEQLNTLNRFAKVFEQAYTRFLDLQKAEAQAREAQIEAALERMRASAMAMHHSRELNEVVKTMYQQFDNLELTDASTDIEICIINEETGVADVWQTELSLTGKNMQLRLPMTKFKELNQEYLQWKKTKPESRADLLFIQTLNGRGLINFLEQLNKLEGWQSVVDSFRGNQIDQWVTYNAYFRYGMLTCQNENHLNTDLEYILPRFAKVFEQTYTRFLDLKKAEAQAREAQIEAALERVRAASMSMHKSKDLHKVINLVFNQLADLGLTLQSTQIFDNLNDRHTMHIWLSNNVQAYAEQLHIPIARHKHVFITRFLSAIKNGETFFTLLLSKRQKDDLSKLVFDKAKKEDAPKSRQDFIYSLPGLAISAAIGKAAMLTVMRFDAIPYSPAENEIIKRFGNVFDQSYTRFLDLKKAEAQARESKIEAALEKVRAASMAMHKSEEFSNVAVVLANQFDELNIDYAGFSINIVDPEDLSALLYVADVDLENGQRIVTSFPTEKLQKLWIGKESLSRRKKGDDNFTLVIKGDQLNEFIEFTIEGTGTDRGLQSADLECLYFHNAFFDGFSCLSINTLEPLPEGHQEIFRKMARTFGFSYRRFLDLQKAEAQAREAQIEAALERVRSASMAMHSSDDLRLVIAKVFEQVSVLGFDPTICEIIIIDKKTRDAQIWQANVEQNLLPNSYHVSYSDHPFYQSLIRPWLDKEKVHLHTLEGDMLKSWSTYLFTATEFKQLPKEAKKAMLALDKVYIYDVVMRHGLLEVAGPKPLDGELRGIMKRVAVVFDQAYTRFLDIQTAEAQAREAQIEVALERVRAATMAMHGSSDLYRAAGVLFEQLVQLGVNPFTCGFVIGNETKSIITQWMYVPIAREFEPHLIPYESEPIHNSLFLHWKRGDNYYSEIVEGDAMANMLIFLKAQPSISGNIEKMEAAGIEFPMWQQLHAAYFTHGYLLIITKEEFSDHSLLIRFSKVFEQTYIRFLDLQKAEKQAREAQIEAALERVRAQSLAMHHTSELQNVINTVGAEFQKLDINNSGGVFISINADIDDRIICWGSGVTAEYMEKVEIPPYDQRIYTDIIHSIKKGPGFVMEEFSNKEKIQFFKHMFQYPPYINTSKGHRQKFLKKPGGYTRSCVISKYTTLFMINHEGYVFTNEENDILKRFGRVFEQSYTRFLDLQRAEAQAREAQVEAAMERIRSASMAMHHSDELNNVLAVLFSQYDVLGIHPKSAFLTLMDIPNNTFSFRMTGTDGERNIGEQTIPLDAMPVWKETAERWKNREAHTHQNLYYRPEELPTVLELMKGVIDSVPGGRGIQLSDFPEGAYTCEGNCKYGYIGVIKTTPPTEEELEIVIRFAREFERLYQRFLDLQHSELQAREAQIEAALERLRAKTMAMHTSDDIGVTVMTFFQELINLGIGDTVRCGIGILDDSDFMKLWTATADAGEESLKTGILDMNLHRLLREVKLYWENNKEVFTYELAGSDMIDYFKAINDAPDYPVQVNIDRLPLKIFHYSFIFNNGILFAFTQEPLPDDVFTIFKRFSTEFGHTYRRYLDLIEAEKRAREAEVEASLERVRSKAMAMHSSEDLTSTISLLLQELEGLNIHPVRCGFGRIIEQSKTSELYVVNKKEDADHMQMIGTIPLEGHPVFEGIFQAWQEEVEYLPVLEGERMISYYNQLKKFLDVETPPEGTIQYGYFDWYKNSGLYAWSETPFSSRTKKVYKKFTAALGLTFNRFNDLKNAEKRAAEAKKEASIDRVRAEIASMRTSEDLERITPLIWRELTTLEVPFFRCGVFIVDEENEMVSSFLTTPEGESLAAMETQFGLLPFFDNAVDAWRKGEVYRDQWDKKEFTEFAKTMLEQGLIQSKETYLKSKEAPELLNLQLVPFVQGLLYVGSSEPLSHGQIEMVRDLGDAFSVAYARYEDFNRLEKTLNDLKSAQSQLVHAEKMASLGELTAGIAHEIQNPLNFVNNFSEVSDELVDEIKEELEAGHIEEVNFILEDLKNNLGKINHHGKRADSIVKGMLLHSRTNKSEKIPTDINALCDEFLRLSYHGLRAKDRSFNADFEMDLDPDIPKINVVPQDIGRVLLNIINNAFQSCAEGSGSAASENRESREENRESPTVIVTTKNLENQIQITISDNGPGIPDEIKDKIFQPFFTTKPTGEGTGLGLSLAYDIIKAHGGRIEVSTSKEEGTAFIIYLPIDI